MRPNKLLGAVIAIIFIITILTSLFCILTSAATGNTTEFAGGSGTETDPYLVETKEHLDNVRNYPNAHFKMTADIIFFASDFAEDGMFYNNNKGWIPIGTNDEPFRGTFDGAGHIIQNLVINVTTLDRGNTYAGLFGQVYGGISRLGVVNANISVQVIRSSQGSTEWCHTNVGGIAGYFSGWNTTIDNCYFSGSIILERQTYNSSVSLGGIVGSSRGDIINCYNIGFIHSTTDGSIGGIVGNNNGSISNCYNIGTVSGSSYARIGGIVGYESNESINNCYYINSNSHGAGNIFNKDIAKACSDIELKNPLTFDGFDFENIWIMDADKFPYPQLISNNHQCGSHQYDTSCDPSCVCGEQRAIAHNFATKWQMDENCHWHVCETITCDVIAAKEVHLYDTVCDTTCDCGYVRIVAHNFTGEFQKDDLGHWHVCETNGCNEIDAKTPHTYSNNCDTTCDCGYIRAISHDFSASWYDAEGHWDTCIECYVTSAKVPHQYGNDCTEFCDCGYSRSIAHDFNGAWQKDASGHWHVCMNDGCLVTDNKLLHQYSNDCDTTCDCGYERTIVHNFTGTYQKDGNGHWRICQNNGCNVTDTKLAHQYSYDCDATCDCGYTRTVAHDFTGAWQKDASGHWHVCMNDGCLVTDNKLPHQYSNDCDTTCDCGYERTIVHNFTGTYQKDGNGHWRICQNNGCNVTDTKLAHQYSYDCDATCDCGYTRTVAHDFTGAWQKDVNGHWHVCTNNECDVIDRKSSHIDKNNDNLCDECSWQIAVNNSSTNTNDTNNNEGADKVDDDNSKGKVSVLIISVSLATILGFGGGLTAYCVAKKRKSKH